MITVMVIIIEKGYLTSSCNNKKTRLIFDNVTKQLRFKNSARSINAFPFLFPQEFDAKGESTRTTRLHDTLSVP